MFIYKLFVAHALIILRYLDLCNPKFSKAGASAQILIEWVKGVLKEFHYYNSEQNGSASIKKGDGLQPLVDAIHFRQNFIISISMKKYRAEKEIPHSKIITEVWYLVI